MESLILKELGETLLAGPPSASLVMDHNKELRLSAAALIGSPIKAYGLICGALPERQATKETLTDEDVRHVRCLKSFHFATLPHDEWPVAIKVRAREGAGGGDEICGAH